MKVQTILNLILQLGPPWINFNSSMDKYSHASKVWIAITYPLHNCIIEVWEWLSNFIPHFIMDVITYLCWDLS